MTFTLSSDDPLIDGEYMLFADAQTYERLRQVKAAYGPRDVIRANHPVPPAPEAGREEQT